MRFTDGHLGVPFEVNCHSLKKCDDRGRLSMTQIRKVYSNHLNSKISAQRLLPRVILNWCFFAIFYPGSTSFGLIDLHTAESSFHTDVFLVD